MERSSTFLRHLATLGPVGLIPFAPGTFGSAVAFALLAVIRPPTVTLALLTAATITAGIYAAQAAESHFGRKDPPQIVIDECAGCFVSMLFIDPTTGHLIAAFVLFRAFDILKPPPIRSFETLFKGGLGVMADDVCAGVYANVGVRLCGSLLALS